MEIQENISLAKWTWWKIGGPADFFCTPKTVAEVQEALQFAKLKNLPVTVLGGGTNVLVSDLGVEGLVICMRELRGTEIEERGGRIWIRALAGTPKSELTKIFLRKKLAPALFMCGLPGDVGGGVVMNAGIGENTVPREFCELVDAIEVVDRTTFKISKIKGTDMEWSYRHSGGYSDGIVVQAWLSWPLEMVADIGEKVKQATQNRIARQPLTQPSCGSTFKNPEGAKAGALIEQAGLKGFQIGDAQVSTKHANFIVNLKNARSKDVKAIIEKIKSEVASQFGCQLQTEIRFLGREE